jgi:hypothetical protein
VERHAAAPEIEDLDRVVDILLEIVEQHVADAAAEDDAQRGPDKKVVDVDRPRDHRRLLGDPERIAPADDQAGDIGERIPAKREGPELPVADLEGAAAEDFGVDGGERNDGHVRRVPSAVGIGSGEI